MTSASARRPAITMPASGSDAWPAAQPATLTTSWPWTHAIRSPSGPRNGGAAAVRAALRAAYPFGPRKHHPYRIWLDEISRQRGLGTKPLGPNAAQGVSPRLIDPRQELLFA